MVNLNWKGKDDIKFDFLKNAKDNPLEIIENYYADLRDHEKASFDGNWPNLLIWGDNISIMASLIKRLSGKINLIYIDPPFATGGEFNLKMHIGDDKKSIKSNRWINKKAYSDVWKGGIDSYLNFLYERLLVMKELLAKNGSIYIHLDWHMGHYIKLILDEIFGVENFRNEIIWAYPAASVQTRRFFMRSYDTIFLYTKSEDYIFNDDPQIYMEFSERVKNALKTDDKGKYYYRGGSHNGKKLSRKVYIKNDGIFPRDFWNDIPYVRANTTEYQGFSTQKPERLLKRIILASTKENDIVADFFCGSGTSLIVAEKLGRKWIGCDSTKQAINIVRKRLLDIYNSNDLFNWNTQYKKKAKSFNILKTKTNQNNALIPEEFLIQDNPNNLNFIKESEFEVKIDIQNKKCAVELNNYENNYSEFISKKFRDKILSFSDWIDYWSIDFDNINSQFDIKWASFRTPKNRTLQLSSELYEYQNSGTHTILIKVIDIFGIETLQTYLIEI